MPKIGRYLRNRNLFVCDILLCFVSYFLMALVLCPISKFPYYCIECVKFSLISAFIYCALMYAFGIYRTNWIYAGTSDYLRLAAAVGIGFIVGSIIGFFIKDTVIIFPKRNIAVNFMIVAFLSGLRFFVRAVCKMSHVLGGTSGTRTLVIGAGQLATALLRDIHNNDRLRYSVVGLIDDNENKKGQLVYNTKVLGGRNDILSICRKERIEEIIFAIYTINQKAKSEILEICSKTGCRVRLVPGFEESLSISDSLKSIRDVEIEDLLEREPVHLDNNLIGRNIKDRVVLVTGGGGSIGSELCRQIAKFKPKKLILIDIYENTTYEVQNELEDKYPDLDLEVLIASIRDEERMSSIFRRYAPDMVFHAAAHKHVPLMEDSPAEAIDNNVFGTYNVAKCADKYGVKTFVMISTDKAVNPTNIMGASKRVCEMIIQAFSRRSKTKFALVRFGNVLGSHGSVVPRFKKQIAAGGPVTVTHPEITRFFMTIPEAAQLVLQAAAYANGGEIFVLDMGKPVKIRDLARNLISLSGYVPDVDIKIEYVGLRPGEKLYEELLMDEEGLTKTTNSKIFIGNPIDIDTEELKIKLKKLKDAAMSDDSIYIKQVMAEVVPTYTIKENKHEQTVEREEKSEIGVVMSPSPNY